MRIKKARRVNPSISITPLIDVVLLLVIFFMLSSTFVVQPGIKVRLPKAVMAEQAEPRDLVLILTREGALYLNDRKVTEKQLAGELAREFKKRKDAYLIIRADKDARHGRVVALMDIAKQAGAKRLAIATEPKPRRRRAR
ncbi:MAG: ExbD/TolR family protein [Nitrospinota bacterium]